jgi:hypothetical protein
MITVDKTHSENMDRVRIKGKKFSFLSIQTNKSRRKGFEFEWPKKIIGQRETGHKKYS